MTELATYLERLGLGQYLDTFIGEGFDTLETLLDIQETDFDALNVKLGHRRKLQRAIAEYRGIPFERIIASTSYESSSDGTRAVEGAQTSSPGGARGTSRGAEPKRKYRRHPKPDENAPERPPSAYVIFSNKVREEVKDQALSFTQIAKLVGERWQKLDSAGKEPYEAQANAAKERYNIQFSTYKKTEAYKEYGQYLAEFKAKHGGSADQKRPRLEPEASNCGGGILAKATTIQSDSTPSPLGHLEPGREGHEGRVRGSSTGSLASSTHLPAHQPLQPVQAPLEPPLGNSYPTPLRAPVSSSRADSPLGARPGRGLLSSKSSPSDHSPTVRSDGDPLVRAASLSLSTPSSATSPLLPPPAGVGITDQSSDGLRRYHTLPLQNTTPSGFGIPSSSVGGSSAFGQVVNSTISSEGWRSRHVFDQRSHHGERVKAMQPPLPSLSLSSGGLVLPPLNGSDRSDPHKTLLLPLPRSSPTLQQRQPPAFSSGGSLADSPRPTPYPFDPTQAVDNDRERQA